MISRARFDRYFPNFAAMLLSLVDGLAVYRTPGRRPPRGQRQVVLAHEPLEDGASLRPNGVVAIQSKDWLSFEMVLPRISVKEQKEVVALEIADRTPFQPGETIFCWNGPLGGTCTVNLVRHDLIETMRQHQPSPHAFPRWLVCDGGRNDQFIDLAPKARNPFQLPLTAATAISLFTIVTGGISLTEAHGMLTEANARHESITLAKAQNSEYNALRDYVDGHHKSADLTRQSTESRKGKPSVFRLLEELTKATPDHSFLLELDVTETGINIVAVSEQPEDLLRSLEASTAFKNARFLGAANAEKDRFTVQVGFEIEAMPE